MQMDWTHKLKNVDDFVEIIKDNLEEREKSERKKHMANMHGDYIKSCAWESRKCMNKLEESLIFFPT